MIPFLASFGNFWLQLPFILVRYFELSFIALQLRLIILLLQ